MRVVLDTDVVVASLRSPLGGSAALMLAVDQGRLGVLVTVPLFIEYEAVCRRPEHRLAAGLTEEDLSVFFNRLVDLAEPVETWFLWRPQLRDPGDELVLEAAVNGRADALVTFNRRHFLPGMDRFGIPVLLPGELLTRMRS
ncbi:MAG: putative toxin-antitoxin system toxin component, PIN family [Azospirillaceae bacterium]|nr:putative toxin-antitoxin system toxin component, PIN family [Azospirillaceae bacterium]